MNRREWMQSGIGVVATFLATGRLRGDEPQDDSDPVAVDRQDGAAHGQDSHPGDRAISRFAPDPGARRQHRCAGRARRPDRGRFGRAGAGQEIFETVKRVGGKPVSRLINTHWHFDHAGGNEVFARSGATVLATAATRKRLSADQYSEVFKLTTPASPAIALPTLTSDDSSCTSARRSFTSLPCHPRTPMAT